jgi:hypothetical protein
VSLVLYGITKEECLLEENYKYSKMSATLWDMKGAISPHGKR